jgi:hypothetical protein
MTSIKFEITWEDVQDIAKQRDGQNLNKKVACFLLADIESGVRGWFDQTKGDAISDSLSMFLPERRINDPHEPREYNDAEGVVTMRELA